MLVDDVRSGPDLRDVDTGCPVEAVERLDERLARNAMEHQRDRVDGRRHEIGADAGRDDGVDEAGTSGSLDEETDRETCRLTDPCDELLGDVREQGVGRVVDDDAGRAEGGDLPRLLDEQVDLAATATAVDEAGMERLAGRDDGLAGRLEVRDIVERIVKAEDVDAVLGCAADEPRDDVRGHGSRPDEEAAAQRDPERCRRARVDRPDPLPRALEPSAHRRLERAAAGNLEVREACAVEDLRDPQNLAGWNLPRKRFLREQPDGRVDELWHGREPTSRSSPDRAAF